MEMCYNINDSVHSEDSFDMHGEQRHLREGAHEGTEQHMTHTTAAPDTTIANRSVIAHPGHSF